MRILVFSMIVLSAVVATAQEEVFEGLSRGELPTHTRVTSEALRALDARLSTTVVGVRTTTDLGPRHTPRFLEGDGAATWTVLVPDEPAVLVTAYAHVAQAATIEVQIGDAWMPATVDYGTPMFDLAVLRVPDVAPPEEALPLAEEWSMGISVFAPASVVEDPRSLINDDSPAVRVGSLGAPPPEQYSFYVRALFDMRNGFPVVSLNGELLGVMSVPAPGRAGGSLAIPFQYIRVWRDEWSQLDPTTPIGWTPRIRHETIDLETGEEALR